MLRETNSVYEFNALFKHSRGIPSLLQKSQRPDPDDVISWRPNEYEKAKEAIGPGGHGLGKDFLRHFLPPHSVASNNTLQTAIAAYYQERWQAAASRIQPAEPFLSRKHGTHGGITRRKLGIVRDYVMHVWGIGMLTESRWIMVIYDNPL